MENVLESLSPLSPAVHDFASLSGHAEGNLATEVEEALVQASRVEDEDEDVDEDDDSPVNNIVVPTHIGGIDEDDPIASLAVASASDHSQVIHHHPVAALTSGTTSVEDDDDDEVTQEQDSAPELEQSANVVTLDGSQLVQATGQEGILLTTDADGNLSLPVSADHVIRFLMQTSDGNVVTANDPVEAIKLSLSGLMTTEGGEVTQTVQALTLPDGTTTLIGAPSKEEPGPGEQTVVPKFGEGQAIKLEDGTTAVLQNTPPEAMSEGLHAIQLEDGTTAFIAPSHSESLFTGQVHQLDPALHLEQLANQTMVASLERPSEKALVIGDKAYKCMYEDCGRLYTTHHHLKVHERSHTGDRPFQCEFPNCGKTFATGYGLKSHNRVHTGEKPYPCPHTDKGCEKAFKTSGDLQKHVRTHTGERPFKCPFEGCTQSFTTSNIRKVHIRTHTGERPYICDVEGCGRAFASATNYKNHIRIHTGEKPYVCSVQGCGKRFTEYSSLYKHHVVHTHTKPYTCHCGKTYRQTSTLAMHKRTAHGEEGTGVLFSMDNGMTESEEPSSKKQRLIKTETVNEDQSASSSGIPGHYLVNASDGSQVVLFQTQSINPLPAITTATTTPASSNGAINNTTTITTTTRQEEPSETTSLHHHSSAQQQPQQTETQHLPGLVALQQGLHGLQALQALPGLQGLTGLTLAENGQQVLVVTDPSQLEALQQLAQQFENFSQSPDLTSAQISVAAGGASNNADDQSEEADGKVDLGVTGSPVVA